MSAWTCDEHRLAAAAWAAGMCARCIAAMLRMDGFPARTTRAIRARAASHREDFPVRPRYAGASDRGRGRAQEMRRA